MSETKGNQMKCGSSSPVSTSNLSSGHFNGPILVTATFFPKHLKRHPQHLPFGASLVVQTVKNLPAMWETWVRSLGWEDPLEKGMATHSIILAYRIPGTGSQTVRQDWVTYTFTMISVRFQGKPFNITVIQVYAPTSNAEEAEVEWFYEDIQTF